MKHTLTVTWESRWTSDNLLLEADPGERRAIRSSAVDLVRDWVDQDAHHPQVSIDGVTVAEQGEDND